MKYIQCDRCKLQSTSDLEQMTWKSGGEERTVDLCPSCRDIVKAEIKTAQKIILNNIYATI